MYGGVVFVDATYRQSNRSLLKAGFFLRLPASSCLLLLLQNGSRSRMESVVPEHAQGLVQQKGDCPQQ